MTLRRHCPVPPPVTDVADRLLSEMSLQLRAELAAPRTRAEVISALRVRIDRLLDARNALTLTAADFLTDLEATS